MALTGLHHVHLKARDLPGTLAFTSDFGLVEAGRSSDGKVYLRGAGSAAYHVVLESADASSLAGLAFGVDSREDLERAISQHGGTRWALSGPGGGEAVQLTDPEGIPVHLVYGVAERKPDPLPDPMIFNQGGNNQPRKGAPQMLPELAPPALFRLGHIGLFVRNFAACDAWYREVLGLLPSDQMWVGQPSNMIGGFYRINRGKEFVDHHTVAMFAFGKSDLHHISFEVQNSAVQFRSHRWLERKGHQLVWGVGRHIKGSHVFDVWRCPSGYRFETFSDTDLFDADYPVSVYNVSEGADMDAWSDRDAAAYFE